MDGDLDRDQFQAKKHASLDVKSSKQLQRLLKGTTSSSEDEFEHQRKSFQARKHKSLDARHISFKLDKEASPTPSTSSDEDYDCDRSSLLQIDADITKPIVIDLNVNIASLWKFGTPMITFDSKNFVLRILIHRATTTRRFRRTESSFNKLDRSVQRRKSRSASLIWS